VYCVRITFLVSLILAGAAHARAALVHELAASGDLTGLKSHLESAPDSIRSVDRKNRTALHVAADRGRAAAVELLLSSGAEVDARDGKARTPLHLAAFRGHVNVARRLLEHGASKDLTDRTGKRAIDAAAARGRREIVNLLLDEEIVRLSGRVHRITPAFSSRINIVVSAGPDGVLIVDSGERLSAESLLSAIESLGKGKPKYVINTHQHPPHIEGNAVVASDAVIIDYKNAEQFVAAGVLKRGDRPLRGYGGRAFDEYFTLRFNGEEIRLIYAPGGHTSNDLIVHFVESDVAALADLLDSQSFPSCGPNVPRYLEIIDAAIDVFPSDTTFVAGHGRDSDLNELREYRAMLTETIEAIHDAMRAGKTAGQMQRERILKKWDSRGEFLPQLGPDYWIQAVCESYRNDLGDAATP